jgi:pimeloyl-ACP methyl ester carboxylesterase
MTKAFPDLARRVLLWLNLARQSIRANGGSRLAYLGFAACSALLSACGFLPQPHIVPMPALHDRQPGDIRPRRLIVMLPGIYNKASDFIDEGFVKDLRIRGIEADVLIPEAHFGYYEARDVQLRLEADIFAPARAQGYKEIWIVGISLGGLGSLLYGAEYAKPDSGPDANAIAGILLIAPFPGTDAVLAEIRKAGGPEAWALTPQSMGGEERYALRWLIWASRRQARKDGAGAPQIYMGTGKADRLFEGQHMFSDLLPPANVHFVEGGHDWKAWRKIWHNFLDNGPWALETAKQAHLDRIRL